MATGTPVWRDIADAAVLAALEPGAPAELDPTPDVLVVGGGMVGLATAAMCTRAGLGRVQLIERDGLAEAASGRAAAMLSPEPHVWTDPPAFVELGRASFDLWRALDVEWSGALGVEPCGWLVALTDPIPAGVDLGSRVEVLDSDGAHAAEPELGEVAGGLLVKDQGRVHPLVAASAFAARVGSVGSGVESTLTRRSRSVFSPALSVCPSGHRGSVFTQFEANASSSVSNPCVWISETCIVLSPGASAPSSTKRSTLPGKSAA